MVPPASELIGKTIDCILDIPGLRSSPNLHLAISFFQQSSGLSTERGALSTGPAPATLANTGVYHSLSHSLPAPRDFLILFLRL